MALRCIAIERKFPSLALISDYIRLFPGLELLQGFNDISTAAEFLHKNNIDLLFIELYLPLDKMIKEVRSLQKKLLIIFTINSKSLPTDVLKLDAVDYLVKPFSYVQFTKAVDKAISLYEKRNTADQHSDVIYVRSMYQLIRVQLDEVEYIESMENYIKIHFSNGKFIMALMPLKKILEKIPQEKFVRIHRSYIIALDKIKNIGSKKIKLSFAELPAGDSYFSNLKKIIR